RYRVLLVARRGQADWDRLVAEARSRLESVAANGRPARRTPIETGHDASGQTYAGAEPSPRLLPILFPAPGSPYGGMIRQLACVLPGMQAALSRMNEIDHNEPPPLSDRIYPPTAFDESTRRHHEDALRDTRCAQPSLGAASLGLVRILEHFGIRADMVGG